MDFDIKRSRFLGRGEKYINGPQAIAYEYCLQVARALRLELSENALASLPNLDANPGRCPPHRLPGLNFLGLRGFVWVEDGISG